LRIAILQFEINIDTPDLNINKGIDMCRRAAMNGAGFILMPEMWSTGLYPELKSSTHLNSTQDILGELEKISAQYNTYILAGSLPKKGIDGIYNCAYLVKPEGIEDKNYDKLHLFKVGREDKYTRGGKKLIIYELPFGRVSPFICYDLRFPEIFRSLSMRGSEIITISAQWPLSRKEHWLSLTKARAIENQSYLLASNLCGHDGRLNFAASSMIIDPWGKIIAEAGDGETIIYGEIDREEVSEIRKKFPFVDDSIWKDKIIKLSK